MVRRIEARAGATPDPVLVGVDRAITRIHRRTGRAGMDGVFRSARVIVA